MWAKTDSSTYCRFEDWELDYVSRNLHESDVELAERIGRTTSAVFNMRVEIDRLVHGGNVRRADRAFAF